MTELTFDIVLDESTLHFGTYADDSVGVAACVDGSAHAVVDLVNALATEFEIPDEDINTVIGFIPPSLTVRLDQLVYSWLPDASPPSYLFAFALGTGFDLSQISPLLAQALPDDELLGVEDLLVYITSQGWAATSVTTLNGALETLNGLLAAEDGEQAAAYAMLPERDIDTGMSYGYKLCVAGTEYTFGLTVDDSDADATTESNEEQSKLTLVSEKPSYTLWYDLQKSVGAAQFERLGLSYNSDDNELWFVLDATITSSSMELSLQGLAFGTNLSAFDPDFRLDGIGLSYSASSGLTMKGQFLQADSGDYEGAVIVATKTFSLAALGAFGKVENHPSLFMYGVLDKPIGGPPFFFVEGLAAGIGYNRALTTPAIEDIPDFPLVLAAITPPSSIDIGSLTGMMEDLEDDIAPSVGAQFYAFGVKFNTFKILDSFALFIALVDGDAWKIRMLGYSTLTAPLPKDGEEADPLAYLELALDGTIDPSNGSMGIQGQLTDNSFVFSKDCTVTGGFAFYAWFSGDNEGDFVQTIGGYHPDFDVPSHYPTVPRLALDWRVDSSITVEGELYFALTPRMLMAGGYIKATWAQDGIEAWFKTCADFLVSWKPYYYSIRLKVDVGASAKIKVNLGFTKIHKKISVHVGAQLDLWGPEFSGKAKIKCSLLSFTIAFGAGKAEPKALTWSEFRSALLPDTTQVCTIQATSGVVATATDGSWVMAARDLALQIVTLVPITGAQYYCTDDDDAAPVAEFDASAVTFGLAPMDISGSGNEAVTSTMKVWITNDSDDTTVGADAFELKQIEKRMPGAVWGTAFSPSLNDHSMIEGALVGFSIEPKNQLAESAETTVTTSAETLGVNIDPVDYVFAWNEVPLTAIDETLDQVDIPAGEAADAAYHADGAGADIVSAIRSDLDDVVLGNFNPALFRCTPQIEAVPQTSGSQA